MTDRELLKEIRPYAPHSGKRDRMMIAYLILLGLTVAVTFAAFTYF